VGNWQTAFAEYELEQKPKPTGCGCAGCLPFLILFALGVIILKIVQIFLASLFT
jgi:hypothetical protein